MSHTHAALFAYCITSKFANYLPQDGGDTSQVPSVRHVKLPEPAIVYEAGH